MQPAIPITVASRLRILDALRGLAALYVALSHAGYLLYQGRSPFAWGHEAVILFFVLSGFAIHLRAAKNPAAPLGVLSYFLKRAKRLYPPLLLALALTLALDTLAAHWQWSLNLHLGTIKHDAHTLLGNLFFLMDNWGNTPFACFGSNNPLWSLRYEAAFYLLYPLLWWLNHKNAWLALGATFALALLFALVSQTQALWGLLRNPLELLCVWWLGAFLAEVYVGRIKIALRGLALLVLLLPLGLRMPGQGHALMASPYVYWILGLGFVGLIALTLAFQRTPYVSKGTEPRLNSVYISPCLRAGFFLELLGNLGDCSYSLYVLHMPILVFIGAWRLSKGALPSQPWWALGGVALCVLVAWLAHFIVEKPFMQRRA